MSASSIPPKSTESKEEIKEISPTQLAILASFVGPTGHELYPDGGMLTETIKDSKDCDLGTKVLYIARSITQDCKAFNESLDKLYRPELVAEAKEENIELIRALKRINDICFNNEVKLDREVAVMNTSGGATQTWEYPSQLALTNFFGSLGTTVNPAAFQTATREMVSATIRELREQDEKKENVIPTQSTARLALEASTAPQVAWRVLLGLPTAQQFIPFEAPLPDASIAPESGDHSSVEDPEVSDEDEFFDLGDMSEPVEIPLYSEASWLGLGLIEVLSPDLPPPLVDLPSPVAPPLVTAPQALFQPIPVFIVSLAETIGLPSDEVLNIFQTNPDGYARLSDLRLYIRNFNFHVDPEAPPVGPELSLEEVLNTTNQERRNLITAYPYIVNNHLTVEEARNLTEAERQIILHAGSDEVMAASFEQLQKYRQEHAHGAAP